MERCAPPSDQNGGFAHPVLPIGSLIVRETTAAGRGVFAQAPLRAGTVVEVSHVLLFPARQYQTFGRHTELDSYTYVWKKTEEGAIMALALGIGSLFNHSSAPNVSYRLDRTAEVIRYTLMHAIQPGDELCISYGTGKMWWEEQRLEEEGENADGEEDILPFAVDE